MAKKNDYFEIFIKMAKIANQAAGQLQSVLKTYDPYTLQGQLEEMHSIEFAGDACKHDLLEKLSKDFITPIEREDIIDLANELDDVTDHVEDVLIKMYMYNILHLQPAALEFVEVVVKCCANLLHIVEEFSNFRKSKSLKPLVIEMNHLEEKGDKLYIEAIRALYTSKSPPLEIMSWTEVYTSLEKCCDTCEHAADVVSGVIMKNS